MIYRSYVFVNRKTEISKKFFTADIRTAGGVQLRKNPAVTGENFRAGGRKAAKFKSAAIRVKNIVFFRKICVMPIDKRIKMH